MDIFGPKAGDTRNFISAIDGVDALMGGFMAGLEGLAASRQAAEYQHDVDSHYYDLYLQAKDEARLAKHQLAELNAHFKEFMATARQLCATNEQQATQIENLYAVLKNRQRIKT